MIKICPFCKKEFNTYASRDKYCSRDCYALHLKKYFQTHKQPWDGKEFTKEHRNNLSISHKGIQSGKKHPMYRGGRTTSPEGYIRVSCPNHPYNHLGYVFEHRLIIEQHIGRTLKRTDRVHHLNGNKSDNRLNNLMAFTSESAHQRFHANPNNVKLIEIIFDGRIY